MVIISQKKRTVKLYSKICVICWQEQKRFSPCIVPLALCSNNQTKPLSTSDSLSLSALYLNLLLTICYTANKNSIRYYLVTLNLQQKSCYISRNDLIF